MNNLYIDEEGYICEDIEIGKRESILKDMPTGTYTTKYKVNIKTGLLEEI